jgi:hypothetical protein
MSDSPDDAEEREEDPIPVETVDLTDPVKYRQSRDKVKREAQEEESFWRSVFDSKIGRRVMWRLLQDDCHGFSPPFACGPNGFPQHDATWFQAGQYAIGQRLYQRWRHMVRDGVALMEDENDPRFMKARPERRRSE